MRGSVYRRRYLKMKKVAIAIQSCARGKIVRNISNHIMKFRKELTNNGEEKQLLFHNEIIVYKTNKITVPTGFLSLNKGYRMLYMTSYGRLIFIKMRKNTENTFEEYQIFENGKNNRRENNNDKAKLKVEMRKKGGFEVSGMSRKRSVQHYNNNSFGGMNKLDKIIILDQQVDHNIGIIETTSQIYQNILFSMTFCNDGTIFDIGGSTLEIVLFVLVPFI